MDNTILYHIGNLSYWGCCSRSLSYCSRICVVLFTMFATFTGKNSCFIHPNIPKPRHICLSPFILHHKLHTYTSTATGHLNFTAAVTTLSNDIVYAVNLSIASQKAWVFVSSKNANNLTLYISVRPSGFCPSLSGTTSPMSATLLTTPHSDMERYLTPAYCRTSMLVNL